MSLYTDCVTPLSLITNLLHTNPECLSIYHAALPTDGASVFKYSQVFGMTYVLELPIYFLFLHHRYQPSKILLINFILNIATHPIVYLGMPAFFVKWDMDYLPYLLIAEFFAPATEALLLKKLFHSSWRLALWAAILANLFSWTVGAYWID